MAKTIGLKKGANGAGGLSHGSRMSLCSPPGNFLGRCLHTLSCAPVSLVAIVAVSAQKVPRDRLMPCSPCCRERTRTTGSIRVLEAASSLLLCLDSQEGDSVCPLFWSARVQRFFVEYLPTRIQSMFQSELHHSDEKDNQNGYIYSCLKLFLVPVPSRLECTAVVVMLIC